MIYCDFRLSHKCTVCWGKNCKYRGGTKIPRIKSAPGEYRVPQREKPQREEIKTY